MNKGQGGFTLVELLVAIAISSLITSGLTLTIFQVFSGNARNSSEMTVVRQVQNAGHFISRDVLMAQVMTPAEAITVSWDQRESGDLGDEDRLYFAFSGDGGGTWSDNIEAFRNDDPPSSYSYTIPGEYLTASFKMRFYLEFNVSDEYAYLDNITISQGEFADDCSSFANWNNGAKWTILSGEFQGQGSGTTDDLTLTMTTNSLDLSSYQGASSGFPLTLTWTGFGIDGDEYRVVYTLVGDELKREYYINSVLEATTFVAQYIDSGQTICEFSDGVLTLTITASIGGYKPATETRTYEITPRPG
jgi:prepilin-type N-terminal cleavage/methylation domain-containing protein